MDLYAQTNGKGFSLNRCFHLSIIFLRLSAGDRTVGALMSFFNHTNVNVAATSTADSSTQLSSCTSGELKWFHI